MKKSLLILALLPLMFFCGCQSSNIDEYPDFIGRWYLENNDGEYEVVIYNNGSAKYYRETGNTTATYSGKAVIKEKELKIGFKKFQINAFPFKDDDTGLWHFTADNLTFTRQ